MVPPIVPLYEPFVYNEVIRVSADHLKAKVIIFLVQKRRILYRVLTGQVVEIYLFGVMPESLAAEILLFCSLHRLFSRNFVA